MQYLCRVFAWRDGCRELVGHDDDDDTERYNSNDDEQLEALEASDVSAQCVFCVLEM